MSLFIRKQMPRANEGKKAARRYHYGMAHRRNATRLADATGTTRAYGWKFVVQDKDVLDVMVRGA